MAKPRMQPMVAHYVKLPKHPVAGWSVQCAIRMSMTLAHVGVYDSASYRRAGYATDQGWALRAEDLYQWLRLKSSLGAAQIIRCTSYSQVPLDHGIVYLRNCWRRSRRARTRTGDHIDFMLWHKTGPRLLTAWRWPQDCSNDILYQCRDGKIRFWPCVW